MEAIRPGDTDHGYGDIDRKLFDELRSAASREEADKIAKDHGLADAEDAVNWLRERS